MSIQLTAILSTDIIRDSRTTINNNFSSLNSEATSVDYGLVQLATNSQTSDVFNNNAITPKTTDSLLNNYFRRDKSNIVNSDVRPLSSLNNTIGNSLNKYNKIHSSSGVFLSANDFLTCSSGYIYFNDNKVVLIDESFKFYGETVQLDSTHLNNTVILSSSLSSTTVLMPFMNSIIGSPNNSTITLFKITTGDVTITSNTARYFNDGTSIYSPCGESNISIELLAVSGVWIVKNSIGNWQVVNGNKELFDGDPIFSNAANNLMYLTPSKVYGTGDNNGQLGLGDSVDRKSFAYFNNEKSFSKIANGKYHSLALDASGKLYASGTGSFGKLGTGNVSNTSAFVSANFVGSFDKIGCSIASSYAISSNNDAYSFGYNVYGVLGVGDDNTKLVPTRINTLQKFDDIKIGEDGSSIAVGDNGIYTFGRKIRQSTQSFDANRFYSFNGTDFDNISISFNNYVNQVVEASGNIYCVGAFTSVSAKNTVGYVKRNRFASFDLSGNLMPLDFNLNNVATTISVNNENVVVGGTFSALSAIDDRPYFANINGGSYVYKNIKFNGYIYDIKLSGNNIYACGSFNSVSSVNYPNGISRGCAALFNTDGILSAWNPNCNNGISSIALSGNNVYLGGSFTTVSGGVLRGYAALFNTDGILSAWNPDCNRLVNSIAVANNNVYLGGGFTTVSGGVLRGYAALFNTDGILSSWNPNCGGAVNSIAVANNNIYLAGNFITVSEGVLRGYAALFNADGVLSSWNPKCDNTVFSIELSGNNVYLGGGFTTVSGGVPRGRAALFNTDGILSAWNPNCDNTVFSIELSGNNVYLGGYFTSVSGGVLRNEVALFNTDGVLSAFNPNCAGGVNSIAVSGLGTYSNGDVYLGGYFTSVSGSALRGHAALFNTDGILSAWNPKCNDTIRTIKLSGNNIYIGGDFTTVSGGVPRGRAALFNTDGILSSWNPNCGGTVNSIAVSGNNVYLGGFFYYVSGGVSRGNAALFNTDGGLSSWNPKCNGRVASMSVFNNNVCLAGYFTTVSGGVPRGHAALFNTDGVLSAFNPNCDGNLYSIMLSGNNIYLCGSFTSVSSVNYPTGVSRGNAALFNIDGFLSSWNPSCGGSVNSVFVSDNNVYLGGNFTHANTQGYNFLKNVSVSADNYNMENFTLLKDGNVFDNGIKTNGSVRCSFLSGNNVYIGGFFNSISSVNYPAGVSRGGAALFNTDGVLSSWNPDCNGGAGVYSMDVVDNNVCLAGDFTTVSGGVPRGRAALFNTDGILSSWNPDCDNTVLSIELSGNNIYLAGDFTTVSGGVPRGRAALFNTDGILSAWNPDCDDYVYTITLSGNNVYLGGGFTTVSGGVLRGYAALFNTDGILSAWNPDCDDVVYEIALSGINTYSSGDIYLGGRFRAVSGGVPRGRAALFNTDGILSSWNPDCDGNIYSIVLSGNNVYLAGYFMSVSGGVLRNSVALFNTGGILNSWSPSCNGVVNAIGFPNNNVYLAGNFTTVSDSLTYDNASYSASPRKISNSIIGSKDVQSKMIYQATYILKNDGTYGFIGKNEYGQLGNGTKIPQEYYVDVAQPFLVKQISVGQQHTLFLDDAGNVYSCGHNGYGQLGTGDLQQQLTPVKITSNLSMKDVVFIGCGDYFSYAIDAYGYLWTWGDNTYGQLGLGDNAQRLIPVNTGKKVK